MNVCNKLHGNSVIFCQYISLKPYVILAVLEMSEEIHPLGNIKTSTKLCGNVHSNRY